MGNTISIMNTLGIDETIQEKNVLDFKIAIKEESNSFEKIIDKYLLFGTPYIFKDDENKFYELKNKIAEFLGVSQTNIFVIGSAKLGFSIAPQKRYQHFNEESDIDIAIIDANLFIRYWKILYKYNTDVRAESQYERRVYEQFLNYFFKGWLRPDKFPTGMREKQDWFDFFKSLQKEYNHNIAAGIYYDIDMFNGYNKMNLETIRGEINNE